MLADVLVPEAQEGYIGGYRMREIQGEYWMLTTSWRRNHKKIVYKRHAIARFVDLSFKRRTIACNAFSVAEEPFYIQAIVFFFCKSADFTLIFPRLYT